MDIIVSEAMTNEQVTMQLLIAMKRRNVIAIRVLLRSTHIAFRINGIVETPISDRGYGNTAVENGTTLGHRHDSVESTETPSPNGDAVLVNIRKRTQIESGFHLVFRFLVTHRHVGTFLEISATSPCTTSIDTHHDVPLLSKSMFPNESTSIAVVPRVVNLLIAWSAVLIHEHRILLVGIEGSRLYHPAIELHSFRSLEREKLWFSDI